MRGIIYLCLALAVIAYAVLALYRLIISVKIKSVQGIFEITLSVKSALFPIAIKQRLRLIIQTGEGVVLYSLNKSGNRKKVFKLGEERKKGLIAKLISRTPKAKLMRAITPEKALIYVQAGFKTPYENTIICGIIESLIRVILSPLTNGKCKVTIAPDYNNKRIRTAVEIAIKLKTFKMLFEIIKANATQTKKPPDKDG